MNHIDSITINGFKSIRELNDFPLRALNIFIGANGAGKSNFVKVFGLLNKIAEKRLQIFTGEEGGTDNLLYFGSKTTKEINIKFEYGKNEYRCTLAPSDDGSLFFKEESFYFTKDGYEDFEHNPFIVNLGSGHKETKINDYGFERNKTRAFTTKEEIMTCIFKTLKSCIVYHFHDTSRYAKIRKQCEINDNERLRQDASNLAAYLYMLKEKHPKNYQDIVKIVRLAAPFFDDFDLKPDRLNEDMIRLEWRHAGSDAYFNGSSFSDGTLRFICLTTLLRQPNMPETIILDEPELGLHPAAIALLAGMFESVTQSEKTQIIATTQSVTLANQLIPEDIVVVEREDGQSVFRWLDREKITNWMEDYGIGDLWEKNIIGGRP